MLEVTNTDHVSSEQSGHELLKNMVVCFKDKKTCDVTLTSSTKGIQLKAHRTVLAAASEYFRAMFEGSLKEADTKEVHFDHIDGHTLTSVICFIYTKSVELKTDTVENVLKASHLFQLHALESICCDYLVNQLDLCNCVEIASLAEHYNYKEMYETSFTFALDNFMKLRSFCEFFLMDVDPLIKLISNDELRVSSEEFVFQSVMTWIDYDANNRNKYFEQLFNYIRLTLLQPKFIEDNVEPLACKSNACKDLIFEAYKWHLMPRLSSTLFQQDQVKLRSLKDVMIAVSGWNNTENLLSVGLYYSGADKWIYRAWPRPPENRSDFGSTTLGGKLIIAGGKLASGKLSDRVDCLDMRTLEWTQLSPLIIKKHSCGLAVLNGCIYVVGGINESNSVLNSVEKWNPLTDTWEFVAPMPETDFNSNVSCKNDLLCVVKGQSVSINSGHKSFTYNSITNTWTPWVNVNGKFVGMVTLSIDGVGHLICMSSNEIVSTNLKTDRSITTSAPWNLSGYKAAVFVNRIILYGKYDFQEYGVCGILKTMPSLQNDEGNVILISN